MELTIYTYGHIDAMFYVLNGISMLMQTDFADMLIKCVALASTFYYGLKMAYAGSSGNSRAYLGKIGAMILIINSMLIPKTTMIIRDNVTKQWDKVDNLPYGFAVPIGILEQFGNILTAGFEQAFTPVADGGEIGTSNYRDYGMVFGARLVQDARNWKIKSPEFVYNMDNFIRRCVITDAAIGYKFTLTELLESDDLWKLITEKPSELKRVEIKLGNENKLLTCKEAIELALNPAFTTEIERITKKYTKSELGLAGIITSIFTDRKTITPNNNFKNNINTIFGGYFGSGNSAESNLKQFMMMNSLSDYAKTYDYARASMTQDSSWRIAGELAATYLPILLSVIKGLVYASFIFMVPLMLLGGGGAKYMSYLAVVASLQLWPALNAILNMFIELYTVSQLQDMAAGAVSFTSYSKVGSYSDKIVAVASGLQMVIPYLAFNIVQGGVGGFIQLAGSISGASNSAASVAAQEAVTGNKSFDNYSSGNMQIAMQQGFKTDWNQAYKSGGREYQQHDGVIQRVTPEGKVLLQSGVGITASGGNEKFTLRQGDSAQIAQNLSSAQNILKGEQRGFHEAESNTVQKGASWLAQVAEHASKSEGYSYDKFGEHGKAIQKAVNLTNALSTQHGYSKEKAANIALRAGAGIPIPGISVGGEASISSAKVNNQSGNDTQQINREKLTREDYNNVIKAGMSKQYGTVVGTDKSYSKDLKETYEDQKRAEKSMHIQADKVDTLSRALTRVESLDASYDRDMFDEVQQAVADKYANGDLNIAHRMIKSHDPRVGEVWGGIVQDSVNEVVGAEMKAKQMKFNDDNIQAELNSAGEANSSNIRKGPTNVVEEHAKSQGFNPAQTINNDLKEEVEDEMTVNNIEYDQAKKSNEAIEKRKAEQIEKIKNES